MQNILPFLSKKRAYRMLVGGLWCRHTHNDTTWHRVSDHTDIESPDGYPRTSLIVENHGLGIWGKSFCDHKAPLAFISNHDINTSRAYSTWRCTRCGGTVIKQGEAKNGPSRILAFDVQKTLLGDCIIGAVVYIKHEGVIATFCEQTAVNMEPLIINNKPITVRSSYKELKDAFANFYQLHSHSHNLLIATYEAIPDKARIISDVFAYEFSTSRPFIDVAAYLPYREHRHSWRPRLHNRLYGLDMNTTFRNPDARHPIAEAHHIAITCADFWDRIHG